MRQANEKANQLKEEKLYRRKLLWRIFWSMLIAIAVFVLMILVLFPAYEALLLSIRKPSLMPIDMEGFAGLVTLTVLAGGFLFWLIDRRQKDLAEAAREQSLSFQLFQTIHDRLVNPEQEEARRWILANIPIKPDAQPTADWFAQITPIIEARPAGWEQDRSPGQIYIKSVLSNFDFIGFVSEHFWSAKDADIEWISPPIAKVWERLGPYVRHLSELRREPDYYSSASRFGEYCIRFREEKGLPPSEYVEGI
jgi:hypothetical protein